MGVQKATALAGLTQARNLSRRKVTPSLALIAQLDTPPCSVTDRIEGKVEGLGKGSRLEIARRLIKRLPGAIVLDLIKPFPKLITQSLRLWCHDSGKRL